ncbi:2-oxoglutarate and iron-dependent oxygenase domain-containing protein [Limibacter armeniacum]|uniref:isopenicillin N synthase family dioxygenase n=1 Tax=Limibacter armeniacum TaxID=466084 RepID=UPI002FE5556A
MDINKIATVDFNDLMSGDAQKKAAFVKEMGDSFSNMGFVIVSNHGVTEDLRQELFRVSKKYFELPEDVKAKYEIEGLGGQRGHTGRNKESAKGSDLPDLKEFYHVGQEVEDNDPIKDNYPDNVWPEEVPELEEISLKIYKTFEQTGKNLLRAIALYLGLDEFYFDDKIHNGNSILRMLHYYPQENVDNIPDGAIRAAAHGDINLITLLMGGSAEGLQAQALSGEWINVQPNPNEIVINIGDMLARLTNNKLRSTIHRVINPSKENLKTSRYSMPFFMHPRAEMDLTCLESCVSDKNPKQYTDMTAGEFLTERLRELGLLK